MIRAYYKHNPQQHKDFEDFLFLFPYKRRIEFDFTTDTIYIDGEAFQLSKIEFISDNTAELDTRYEQIARKNQPNGYAGLDENAKLPAELLPTIRVVDVHVVQTISERDGLTEVDEGDIAVVLEQGQTYVWSGSQWIEIQAKGSVLAVDGRTGNVSLSDLYAPKDHDHSRLVGQNEDRTVMSITSQSIWGVTTTWFKSVFTIDQPLSFNKFKVRYPQDENNLTVKITANGQTLFEGQPLSIEKISDLSDKIISLPQVINLPAIQEINFELTFASDVALNMPVPDGSGYKTYHNVRGYTNPLPDVILFFELRLSVSELAELKNGTFLVKTSQGEIDLIQMDGQIKEIEDEITGIKNYSLPDLNGRVEQNEESISLLSDRIDENETNILQLDSKIAELSTNVEQNTNNIAQLQNDVSELTTQVDNIDTAVQTVQDNLTEINSDLSLEISRNTDDISQLNSDLSQLSTRVATNESNIRELSLYVPAIEDNSDNIQQLQDTVSSIQTQVDDHESRITNLENNLVVDINAGSGSVLAYVEDTNEPLNPTPGQIWYDLSMDVVKIYTSNGWKNLTTV